MENSSKKINIYSFLGMVIPLVSFFVLLLLGLFVRRLLIIWIILLILSSVAGIILSIIGLTRRNRYNGSGLIDAILGIVFSILFVVGTIIIVSPEDLRRYSDFDYFDYFEDDDDYEFDDDDDYDYDYYKNKKEVEIIDFSSMTEEEIKNWCKTNNIECSISSEYSDSVEKGKFIRQSISAKEKIEEGKSIFIYFSLGKRPTMGQSNALKKAESYSSLMHMSKRRLYDQLTSEYGEGFTAEEAQYAIDNINADWKANALETAKSYQKNLNMSKSRIYQQLTSEYGEKFTAEEAQYAIDNLED